MLDEIKKKFLQGSILTKLIYINAVAFIVMLIGGLFFKGFENWFSLSGSFKALIYRPWTVISYMFMHADFLHLLINMLWLFWFGAIFLRYFHDKQLLAVFLIGGFSGAALHLIINLLLPVGIGIIGASASVMAVVFAISAYKPDFIIKLLFIGPVKIKYVAIVAFAIDILGAVGNLKSDFAIGDGVAHIAHLGGSFYGLWFAYEMKNGKDITRKFNIFLDELVSWFGSFSKNIKSEKTVKPSSKPGRYKKTDDDYIKPEAEADDNDRINEILDKISKSGYNSLTKEEKEYLFKQKEK